MKSVRLVAFVRPFNPGEIAGFSERRADELVRLGLAVFVDRDGNDLPSLEHGDAAAGARRVPHGMRPFMDDDDLGESPLAGTVTDVAERVLGLDDVELLQRMQREESVGRGRAGVLRTIEDRLASLGRSPVGRPRGDDEPRPPVMVGGALRRLATGAVRRFAPSKAEEERKALDGIEVWGVNDRPGDREPGSLH